MNLLDDLVIRYKETRDSAVFNQIWTIVKPRLMKASNSLRCVKEDKEDCFQNCCVALLRAVEAWDPIEAVARGSHFENYLSLACLNEKIIGFTSSKWSNQMLYKNRVNRVALSFDAPISKEEDGVSFQDVIQDRREKNPEDIYMYKDFIDTFLSWAQEGFERTVIELLICKQYSLTEISKLLNCSVTKVSLSLKNYREKAMSKMTNRMLKDLYKVFDGTRIVMSY